MNKANWFYYANMNGRKPPTSLDVYPGEWALVVRSLQAEYGRFPFTATAGRAVRLAIDK